MNRLEQSRAKLLKKLSDPNDKDDPKWVGRWAARVEANIAKKEKGKSQKQSEKKGGQVGRIRRAKSQMRGRRS
ncbi:MAG TPA: hypothetical protein VL175_06855 [Pirellulales bacterium]|nr:hypothetical protein [Pirellulales bacterium]